MAQTVRSICTSEGLVGFWHGNLTAGFRVVPHKTDLFRALDGSGRNQLPQWSFPLGNPSRLHSVDSHGSNLDRMTYYRLLTR
ncbi:hypothetical protein PsorP6_006777 [Peronosclerospora sorghi]|uniref:Uncharacterized protein n=1 Tax=Peronosclerospora sorghi TaxID=230839 RepID=A0ACC0W5V8_9STRA|nr:hypothetical protein PsorP6_006777 [Peronosclerospora sorghi]